MANPVLKAYLADPSIDVAKRQKVLGAIKSGQDEDQLANLITQKYGNRYSEEKQPTATLPKDLIKGVVSNLNPLGVGKAVAKGVTAIGHEVNQRTGGQPITPMPSAPAPQQQSGGGDFLNNTAKSVMENLPGVGGVYKAAQQVNNLPQVKEAVSAPLPKLAIPQTGNAAVDSVTGSVNNAVNTGLQAEKDTNLGQRVWNAGAQAVGGVADIAGGAGETLYGGTGAAYLNPFDNRSALAKSKIAVQGINKIVGGGTKVLSAPLEASPLVKNLVSVPFEQVGNVVSAGIDAANPNLDEQIKKDIHESIMNSIGLITATKGLKGKQPLSLKDAKSVVKEIPNAIKSAPSLPGQLATGIKNFGKTAERIADEATNKLNEAIDLGIEKGVKPTVVGKKKAFQRENYQAASRDAVKSIVDNKADLELTHPKTGEKVVGELPQNLNQFSEAINQTKSKIFAQYDELATKAGERSASVNLKPVAEELKKFASDKVLNDTHPEVAQYALKKAEIYNNRSSYTPAEAQTAIKSYNESLKAFYRNPTFDSFAKANVDQMIANIMRKHLDDTIANSVGDGYQALKTKYGSLRAIEDEVNHRAVVDARKNTVGLGQNLTDIYSAGEAVHGILSANPAAIASSLAVKGLSKYIKYLNDPNIVIKKMFEKVDKNYKPSVAEIKVKPQLMLPAPKAGAPISQVNVPINLPAKSASTIDAAERSKLIMPSKPSIDKIKLPSYNEQNIKTNNMSSIIEKNKAPEKQSSRKTKESPEFEPYRRRSTYEEGMGGHKKVLPKFVSGDKPTYKRHVVGYEGPLHEFVKNNLGIPEEMKGAKVKIVGHSKEIESKIKNINEAFKEYDSEWKKLKNSNLDIGERWKKQDELVPILEEKYGVKDIRNVYSSKDHILADSAKYDPKTNTFEIPDKGASAHYINNAIHDYLKDKTGYSIEEYQKLPSKLVTIPKAKEEVLIRQLNIAQKYSDLAKNNDYNIGVVKRNIENLENRDYLSRSAEVELSRWKKQLSEVESSYSVKQRNIENAVVNSNKIGIKPIISLDEKGVPVVYFELPSGQVSFHMPNYGEGSFNSFDMVNDLKSYLPKKILDNVELIDNYKWSGEHNTAEILKKTTKSDFKSSQK